MNIIETEAAMGMNPPAADRWKIQFGKNLLHDRDQRFGGWMGLDSWALPFCVSIDTFDHSVEVQFGPFVGWFKWKI